MSDQPKGGNPYLSGPISAVFARTAAPIVLFMLVSGLFTVVDAIFLGRVAVDFYAQQIGARLEDATSFARYLGGSSVLGWWNTRCALKSNPW